jgi:hypothetical protein
VAQGKSIPLYVHLKKPFTVGEGKAEKVVLHSIDMLQDKLDGPATPS